MLEKNTQAFHILELIALSGEFPADAIHLLSGGEHYKQKIITDLKDKKLIRTYYKDKLRGYRLTSTAKEFLLSQNSKRYEHYITGNVETNWVKSEITRRLRLHSIAEVYLLMQNAGVSIYRDDKPIVFQPVSVVEPATAQGSIRNSQPPSQALSGELSSPAFYNSREFKQIGGEVMKIKNARAVGILLTQTDIYLVYNTGSFVMKWDYKSEMRAKAVMQYYLCKQYFNGRYSNENVKSMVFGSNMDTAVQLMTSNGGQQRNYFMLDGNFECFSFLPSDHCGELLLKILCDQGIANRLNKVLLSNLNPPDPKLLIENDAMDTDGNPVLLAYSFDMPRIARFNSALLLQNRRGTLISFDFQKEALQKYCGEHVSIQTIDQAKFERRFFT